jgi:hypothetical protein
MALATAHAPGQAPNLAEPVCFTGADAERFVAELPGEPSPDATVRLRESVASAEAAMSPEPATTLFA